MFGLWLGGFAYLQGLGTEDSLFGSKLQALSEHVDPYQEGPAKP